MAETRVGYWYATGLRDKPHTPRDPDCHVHSATSDASQFVAHVTVENAGKQRFPVPCSLIDEIAAPPGHRIRSETSTDAQRLQLRVP